MKQCKSQDVLDKFDSSDTKRELKISNVNSRSPLHKSKIGMSNKSFIGQNSFLSFNKNNTLNSSFFGDTSAMHTTMTVSGVKFTPLALGIKPKITRPKIISNVWDLSSFLLVNASSSANINTLSTISEIYSKDNSFSTYNTLKNRFSNYANYVSCASLNSINSQTLFKDYMEKNKNTSPYIEELFSLDSNFSTQSALLSAKNIKCSINMSQLIDTYTNQNNERNEQNNNKINPDSINKDKDDKKQWTRSQTEANTMKLGTKKQGLTQAQKWKVEKDNKERIMKIKQKRDIRSAKSNSKTKYNSPNKTKSKQRTTKDSNINKTRTPRTNTEANTIVKDNKTISSEQYSNSKAESGKKAAMKEDNIKEPKTEVKDFDKSNALRIAEHLKILKLQLEKIKNSSFNRNTNENQSKDMNNGGKPDADLSQGNNNSYIKKKQGYFNESKIQDDIATPKKIAVNLNRSTSNGNHAERSKNNTERKYVNKPSHDNNLETTDQNDKDITPITHRDMNTTAKKKGECII